MVWPLKIDALTFYALQNLLILYTILSIMMLIKCMYQWETSCDNACYLDLEMTIKVTTDTVIER